MVKRSQNVMMRMLDSLVAGCLDTSEGNRMGEPKLGSTVPRLTPGLFAEYKGRIARYTITDALSSGQSAASRLRPAALCAAGLESAPLSQPSRAASGA